jgi:hypothetical protein
LTWIMMDTKISMFATEFTWFDQSRFCWFFANEFMQKMVEEKRRNKNDYKQNAKYGDSNYAFKTIKI